MALGNAAEEEDVPERRVALIHRVIVPGRDYPKEYAILVTDKRSIFILQPKTRSGFVLRGEMRYGTALVTDVVPKTLEDYQGDSLDSLAAGAGNLAIPHRAVISFEAGRKEPKPGPWDLFVRFTMHRQGEVFLVTSFEVSSREGLAPGSRMTFYAVPLGVYFKPRRMTKNRETILREYGQEVLETFQRVLPTGVVRP